MHNFAKLEATTLFQDLLASKPTEQGAAVTENTAQSVVVQGLLDQKFLSTSVDFEFFFSDFGQLTNQGAKQSEIYFNGLSCMVEFLTRQDGFMTAVLG